MNRRLVIVAQSAHRIINEQLARLERLRTAGFDVQIAAPFTQELDELAGLGYDTRPLPGADSWNLPGRAAAYPILQADWLENPPLLVHGYESSWAYVTALAGHQAGVPAVFVTKSCHDLTNPVRRRAYRKLGQWATNYIVHHEEDLRGLDSVVPMQKMDLLLGGYGADLARHDPDDDNLVPATRPAGRTVIAARDDVAVREVIDAVKRLHPELGWLRFDGAATPEVLSAADVFLQVDPSDDIGLDLMAAAAMRLPSVAADSRAARTVISDHETGRVAPSGDIAPVLADVIANPKRARDMGIRARARAERRFDRRQIDEQLLTIYDRVLSEAMR